MTKEIPLYTTITPHNYVGPHVQDPPTGWVDAMRKTGEGAPAGFFQVESATEARTVNPYTFNFHRYVIDHQDEYINAIDKHQAARNFFDKFIDGTFLEHAAAIDAVSELNEYNATSDPPEVMANKTAWTRASAEVWNHEYRTRQGLEHIRLLLNRLPIGNDGPDEVPVIATTLDCLVAYHPYIPVRDGVILGKEGVYDPEWINYSGRWTAMDARWKARGYEVDWIFTEAGAIGYTPHGNTVSLNANDGWRHPSVFNGDVAAYIKCLEYWAQKVAEWNAVNNNRAKGGVLFTSNVYSGWEWFRTNQPDLEQIMEHFAQWQPDITPPPVDDRAIIEQAARDNNLINLCPQCALQKSIEESGGRDGLKITSNEYGITLSSGVWVAQNAGTNLDTNKIFVYRYPVGQYDPVYLVIDEVRKV